MAISLWVFVRVSGFVLGLPWVGLGAGGEAGDDQTGAASQPGSLWQIRFALSIALTLIIVPSCSGLTLPADQQTISVAQSANITSWLMILGEFILGYTMGMAVSVVFSALMLAGKLIGFVSGLAAVDIFDPLTGQASNLVAQYLWLFGTAVFFASNGHHRVIEGLMDSMSVFPPGQFSDLQGLYPVMTTLLAMSFSLGIQLSIHIVLIMMMTMVAMAILSRTVPTINLMTVGLPVNILIVLTLMFLTTGIMLTVFSQTLSQIDWLRMIPQN